MCQFERGELRTQCRVHLCTVQSVLLQVRGLIGGYYVACLPSDPKISDAVDKDLSTYPGNRCLSVFSLGSPSLCIFYSDTSFCPIRTASFTMKPKPKTHNIVTTILSSILTLGFLWFFLLAPPSPNSSSASRGYRPNRPASRGTVTDFDLRNDTASSHALQNRERVLILTPVARWYSEYWQNLMGLTYPHDLIDLGFIIPRGIEGDQILEKLKVRLKEVQGKTSSGEGKFNHITILRQDVEVPTSQDEKGAFTATRFWPKKYIDWGRTTCIGTSESSTINFICCSEFVVINDFGTTYFVGALA
jgi:hypothetical protein